MLDEPVIIPTVVLICVLAWVGIHMIGRRGDLAVWGYRLASAALVVYCLRSIAVFEPDTASEFLWIVVRALLLAGLVLGGSWIGLAFLGFVFDHTVVPARENSRIHRESYESERRVRKHKVKMDEQSAVEAKKREVVPKVEKSVEERIEAAYRRFDEERQAIEAHEKDSEKAEARVRFVEMKLDRTVEEILR